MNLTGEQEGFEGLEMSWLERHHVAGVDHPLKLGAWVQRNERVLACHRIGTWQT